MLVGRVWVVCLVPPAWEPKANNPVNRRSGVTAALPPTRNESFPNLVISLAVLSATLMIPSTAPDDKHRTQTPRTGLNTHQTLNIELVTKYRVRDTTQLMRVGRNWGTTELSEETRNGKNRKIEENSTTELTS